MFPRKHYFTHANKNPQKWHLLWSTLKIKMFMNQIWSNVTPDVSNQKSSYLCRQKSSNLIKSDSRSFHPCSQKSTKVTFIMTYTENQDVHEPNLVKRAYRSFQIKIFLPMETKILKSGIYYDIYQKSRCSWTRLDQKWLQMFPTKNYFTHANKNPQKWHLLLSILKIKMFMTKHYITHTDKILKIDIYCDLYQKSRCSWTIFDQKCMQMFPTKIKCRYVIWWITL